MDHTQRHLLLLTKAVNDLRMGMKQFVDSKGHSLSDAERGSINGRLDAAATSISEALDLVEGHRR